MHKNKGLKYFQCEVFGHKALECPDKNDTKLDVAHLIVNKEKALTKKVLIDNLVLVALIDSGSQVTLIRKSVFDKLNHVQFFPLNSTLSGFGKKVATLSVLPNNLSPNDFEINIAPDILQMYESRNKTITLNFVPVKKDGLHVKDDQRIVTKTDPVVVLPESMPKKIKRRAHEKRRPGIKENKDYYFILKLKQKIENSIAGCDHRVLVNHKRRKKAFSIHYRKKTCH
ncbi:uncharacterized protein TNIN_368151 [Trichonephila inaurata madagascariensis]|uniref:Peptidase A2 domain-containing protein n=1 Tax=Trichonephila inaurata madagascariensis TaxID=2747483 RepID=A0A8X7CTA7_9ARAC|nr:uncharacterized protein TNIN_368151 [Trichonephila inaurata madagascariensis]